MTIWIRKFVASLTAISFLVLLLPPGARAARKTDSSGDGSSAPNPGRPTQTPKSTDPGLAKIEREVRRIGVGGNITVFLKNGETLHGAITTIEDERLQITEVDLRQIVTSQYKDVKKVRRGYGGISAFTGKRTSWPSWVKPVAIAGAVMLLLVPIILLGVQKD